MKIAIHIHNHGIYSDPRLIADLAREAEAAGWDGVFTADHLVNQLNGQPSPIADPWIALAAVAMTTSRVLIGPMVTPLPRRRPWQLAGETVTLDRLSNGRLIFGVGSGISTSFTPFGEEGDAKRRATMLEESLDVLMGLWSGQPFSYQGEHFTVSDVTFLPKPVQQPRIPIWVAGHWPHKAPFRRAAKWDGAFIDGPGVDWTKGEIIAPNDLKDSVDYTLDERKKLGLSDPFEIIIGGYTPNPAEMGERLKPYADLGATWWVEAIYEAFMNPDEARARIRRGPPKIM